MSKENAWIPPESEKKSTNKPKRKLKNKIDELQNGGMGGYSADG